MPTQSIQLGVPTTLTQNVAMALPFRKCTLLATVAVQFSADNSTWTADIAASTTGITTAGAYVRCTTGASVVVCKPD